jgi:hypothetical protein
MIFANKPARQVSRGPWNNKKPIDSKRHDARRAVFVCGLNSRGYPTASGSQSRYLPQVMSRMHPMKSPPLLHVERPEYRMIADLSRRAKALLTATDCLVHVADVLPYHAEHIGWRGAARNSELWRLATSGHVAEREHNKSANLLS